jgi:predicted nuclease of predicted toxin-antitoxin system
LTLSLLLDEHISSFLTHPLAEAGIFAQAVAHVGLSGKPDETVWAFAMRHEMAVVTTNVSDFLDLAETGIHPGLILLRESGLTRDEQWHRLKPAIELVRFQEESDFLLNKVLDIRGPGLFRLFEVPPA